MGFSLSFVQSLVTAHDTQTRPIGSKFTRPKRLIRGNVHLTSCPMHPLHPLFNLHCNSFDIELLKNDPYNLSGMICNLDLFVLMK